MKEQSRQGDGRGAEVSPHTEAEQPQVRDSKPKRKVSPVSKLATNQAADSLTDRPAEQVPHRSITPERATKAPAKEAVESKSAEWQDSSHTKNTMNQTFPKSKSGAIKFEEEENALASSLRKSYEKELSSSKKSVKFVDESPRRELVASMVVGDPMDDAKGKVFVVARSSVDSKAFNTNNFYQQDEPQTTLQENKALDRIVSDPRLRIVAPGIIWDDKGKFSEVPKDSPIVKKQFVVASSKRSKSQKLAKSEVLEANPKIKVLGESQKEQPKEDRIEDLKEESQQSSKSMRFEESSELLKSIYEFNKTSRQQ